MAHGEPTSTGLELCAAVEQLVYGHNPFQKPRRLGVRHDGHVEAGGGEVLLEGHRSAHVVVVVVGEHDALDRLAEVCASVELCREQRLLVFVGRGRVEHAQTTVPHHIHIGVRGGGQGWRADRHDVDAGMNAHV